MDCITGHGYIDHVGACEDGSGECGSEAEDLAAPFENTLVKDFKLFRCGRYELAGVGESGD